MTNSGIGTEPQLIRVCLDFDDVESVFFGWRSGFLLVLSYFSPPFSFSFAIDTSVVVEEARGYISGLA